MRKIINAALMGLCLVYSTSAFAKGSGSGTDITGALSDNPARLGQSPVFTMAIDMGGRMPGLPIIQGTWNKWYDADTQRLNIILDVSSNEKAQETAAMLDKLFGSLSGIEVKAVSGLSIGRFGVGTTVTGITKASSTTQATVDTEYSVALDGSIEALGRADGNATFAIPIGKALSVGVTAKKAYILSLAVTGKATANQGDGGTVTSQTTEGMDVGEGFLADAGVMYTSGKLQGDLAIHDLGKVAWKAQLPPWEETGTPAPLREHATNIAHLAGGVSFKPIKAISLGGYFDDTVFGDPQVRLSGEFKPLPFIALRSTIYMKTPNTPGYYTLGTGWKLLGLVFDTDISVHNNLITGGGAKLGFSF